jgi:peptidoglycan/LPS O-acetylase OafA/YrhL
MEFNLKTKINFSISKFKNLFFEISRGNAEPILRSNMPELDFLRGIAVIVVLLYHGFYWIIVNYYNLSAFNGLGKLIILSTSGGWLGVHLFFVLSGFLITGILLDSKERPDYFKRFYSRRALRILPAYLALLFILLIFGVIQWPFLLISAFFLSNFAVIFSLSVQYAPLWTLAIEEQFYLFWPQAVRQLSRKTLTILALSIVLLTPVIRGIAVLSGQRQGLNIYTWFLFDGLAVGSLLAIYLRSKYATRQKVFHMGLILITIGLGIMMIGAPFGILTHETTLGSILQYVPWYILFAGAILLFLIIGTSNLKRFVLWKWLRYFGYISYGLYLIHFFIFSELDLLAQKLFPELNTILYTTTSGLLFRFIIGAGISILIAALSRKYFESRFLSIKNKQPPL